MSRDMVFIGMDLGSFKTSAASSTGGRDVVPSAVGWPKDLFARNMLGGRDVIFGADLIQHRLALNIVRPFEKGAFKRTNVKESGLSADDIQKKKEAARLLVAHVVSLTQPPPGMPLYGVIGAPSRATSLNKQAIIEAASEVFDAIMIAPEPFMIAYAMNRLSDTLVVDVGASAINLCPVYGTLPSDEEQITIPFGGEHVDDNFYNRMRTTFPEAQFSRNMTREIKEKFGFVHGIKEKVIVSFPVRGQPKQFDVTTPLKEACQAIIDPIVHGLRELIARFDPEFQTRMLQNIVLGGGSSLLRGLDQAIEGAMIPFGGAKVRRVADTVYAGAVGALKLGMGLPAESWKCLQDAKKSTILSEIA